MNKHFNQNFQLLTLSWNLSYFVVIVGHWIVFLLHPVKTPFNLVPHPV
jgi:hypothetical protein